MKELLDFIAKAERFFKSAEHLFAIADYDSCVSRCYYAMFFIAEAALMLKGFSPTSHRGVIGLFGKHFVQTGIFEPNLGRTLRRAYDVRWAGDYAIGTSVSRYEAEDLLMETKKFIAEVRDYLEREAK